MSRRIRFPGPLGTRSYSLLNPDLYFRSGVDAQYSFPQTQLIRLAAPDGIGIEFVITDKEFYLPEFERLPDEDALRICKELDQAKRKETGKPLKGTHLFYHVTLGPQATTHQPFNIRSIQDPVNSAEVDAVVSIDFNWQFHEDDEKGWEITVTGQGSRNFIVLDPNRYNPDFAALSKQDKSLSETAEQAQLQLQLAYAFQSLKAGKFSFSFSLLLQLALGANIQYDPYQASKKITLTWGKGTAAGFGLDIGHSSIKPAKLTLQMTGLGASASGGFFEFSGPTFDQSIMLGVKFEEQLF